MGQIRQLYDLIRSRFDARKHIQISWVDFETLDWIEVENKKNKIVWHSPEYKAMLMFHYFPIHPDIPCKLDDVEQVRYFYRKSLIESGGGMINTEVESLDKHIKAVKTIFKLPNARLNESLIYIGCYTIPFQGFSFVIKVQAMEVGVTGQRAAFVLDKMIKRRAVWYNNNHLEGWSADPYDKDYRQGLLMNLAEQDEYDDYFPEHPLSQVRYMLQTIKNSIRFRRELWSMKPFKGKL